MAYVLQIRASDVQNLEELLLQSVQSVASVSLSALLSVRYACLVPLLQSIEEDPEAAWDGRQPNVRPVRDTTLENCCGAVLLRNGRFHSSVDPARERLLGNKFLNRFSDVPSGTKT